MSWDAHPDGPPDEYRVAIAPVDGDYGGGEFGGGLGAVRPEHVRCWHLDNSGQVDCWAYPVRNEANPFNRSPPAESRYTEVTAGRSGSCGVLTDGTAHCFGGGDVALQPDGDVQSVSYHSRTACWLLADGSVGCARLQRSGGEGLRVPDEIADESFLEVHIGGEGNACGLTTSKQVKCWQYATVRAVPEGEFESISFGGNIGSCRPTATPAQTATKSTSPRAPTRSSSRWSPPTAPDNSPTH